MSTAVLIFDANLTYSKTAHISPEARMVAIRRAQVWRPTDIPAMDIKTGPRDALADEGFEPFATVTCDYIKKKMNGRTPKFACALGPEDEVKVKYGRANGEVYAEVAATRLLWALGFFADGMYPVRVVCRNCPADPAADGKDRQPGVTFDPAAIERPSRGLVLETTDNSGWGWAELDFVEPTVGGAPVAHRDALKLLAAVIQHSDSKPEQQRLLCAPGEGLREGGEPCLHPIMMINDLGVTFGHANLYNRSGVGSVNLEQWARARVWADPERCIADIRRSQSGTLDRPRISEAGRQFLADLLAQFTDAQIHDLFEVARFAERAGGGPAATVEEWAAVFKQKRDGIVNHRCPE